MAQNSGVIARRRATGRPFRPGQSGNPGGRPKSRGLVDAIRARYGGDGRTLLKTLHELLTNDLTTDAVRLRVVELVLAYGWGRPQDSAQTYRRPDAEQLVAGVTEAVGRHITDRGVLRLIQIEVARVAGIEVRAGQDTDWDLTKLTVEELHMLKDMMKKAT
jgi:hypothetical protein